MGIRPGRETKVLLSVFGPIVVLFAVLIFFQYKTYHSNKKRLEEQLFKQQGLITMMAASRLQAHTHEIVERLDHLASELSSSVGFDSVSEEMGRDYDSFQGAVDGIAYFNASGEKVCMVTRPDSMHELSQNARFDEFFSMPRLTMMPYISPLMKFPDGAKAVYISYPARAAHTGEFAGVVVAQVGQASLSALCSRLEELNSQMLFAYFDQKGQQVCTGRTCEFSVGPRHGELMTGGIASEIIKRPGKGGRGDGSTGRERLLYYPVDVEGYKWYVSSVMPLSGLDGMARGDFTFLSGLVLFFVAALLGGGIYFRNVYKAKVQAETDAAYHAYLAAQADELAAEKDKLLAVINSIPDGIMLLDKEGSVLDSNSGLKDIMGEEADLKDLSGPVDGQNEMAVGNKTYRIVSVPVVDGGRGPLKEVRILRDVTPEKALAQKKADLVSMITHDVKSPLTAIIGITQWIGSEGAGISLDPEVRDGLETVSRAANRIHALMENFLFLSSIEGMRKPKKDPVNLNTFLGRALLEFQLQAKQKGVSLKYNQDEHSPVVPMDEAQMMRAVTNLVSNALKYTPAGGEVSVSAKYFRDYVAIEVRDNGLGINKEDLPYIFDRHYRAKSAIKEAKGSGLGLAIVKAVVESHSGTIDVDSEEGRGTTFRLRLPLNHS